MTKQTWFAVYYRTGGADNFQWKRAANVDNAEVAWQKCDELRKMGYPAHYDRASVVDTIGLPETYE